jgi:hypothetical protein
MNITSSSIAGYKGLKVPYTLLSTTAQPKGLAIMFPGAGYTVQGPLMHYPTGMYLNENFAVLHINYQYSSKEYNDLTDSEFYEALMTDSKKVIDEVLKKASYDSYYLAAKSIGTIPLSSELSRKEFKDAKVIWLTPLLKEETVYKTMRESRQSGICFIGDGDHHYVEERFTELSSNPKLQLHLITGANHSLEQDFHVLASIDTHLHIMKDIETFIQEA